MRAKKQTEHPKKVIVLRFNKLFVETMVFFLPARQLAPGHHTSVRTRFAPSPTGHLHPGHIANIVAVWGAAEVLGAQVVLRIEDHDRGRCRPEYEVSIWEDLEWLGVLDDELRGRVANSNLQYRQSNRNDRYFDAFTVLKNAGLTYKCTCSRADIQRRCRRSASGEWVYDGHCAGRGIADEEEGCVRLRVPAGVQHFLDVALGALRQDVAGQCGDFPIVDRSGQWTYQFAVCVDDVDHAITHIIRGEDLVDSVARQAYLRSLLGGTDSVVTLHHPLLKDTDGRKLSKRTMADAIRLFREAGWSAERLVGEVCFGVGWTRVAGPVSRSDWADIIGRAYFGGV